MRPGNPGAALDPHIFGASMRFRSVHHSGEEIGADGDRWANWTWWTWLVLSDRARQAPRILRQQVVCRCSRWWNPGYPIGQATSLKHETSPKLVFFHIPILVGWPGYPINEPCPWGATGERLKEATKINLSLSALGTAWEWGSWLGLRLSHAQSGCASRYTSPACRNVISALVDGHLGLFGMLLEFGRFA